MERFLVIRIKSPSQEEIEEYRQEQGIKLLDRGQAQTGPRFRGDLAIAHCANDYIFQTICRVLKSACVPYSVEQGKAIGSRRKKHTSSTQSELTMVSLMSEVAESQTDDCESTTAESVTPPQGGSGITRSPWSMVREETPNSSSDG